MKSNQQEQQDFNQRLEARSKEIVEDIRNPYFRDQTKIIHSCAFRRLKDKTQMIAAPENDHLCTRVEHVLHVATVAKSICCGLNKKSPIRHLNEDLAFAIGLGHDLGHAPFGHTGEKVLDRKICKTKRHFMHELNGYRMIEKLEPLNLTFAVKDGIMCHNGEEFEQYIKPAEELNDLEKITSRHNLLPSTMEGCIARFSDKIAYFGRDIEDALNCKMITLDDIPQAIKNRMGHENRKIIHFLINDLIENSSSDERIGFSDNTYELMRDLKDFNYSKVYHHPKLQERQKEWEKVVSYLYDYIYDLQRNNDWEVNQYFKEGSNEIDHVFGEYLIPKHDFYILEKYQNRWSEGELAEQITVDFISGMTDVFAVRAYKNLVMPKILL